MPTLADIANQVSHALSQIEAHTKAASDTTVLIREDSADVKARADVTNAKLDAGFSFLGKGLFALLESQRVTNAHLTTLIDQHDVTIRWLVKVTDTLREQLRALERGLVDHDEALADLRTIAGVVGLSHPYELLQVQRHQELQAKLAEQCPPRATATPSGVQPCREPEVTTHDPRGQGWNGQWLEPEPPPEE